MYQYTIEFWGAVAAGPQSGRTVPVYVVADKTDRKEVVLPEGKFRALRWENGIPTKVPVLYSGICSDWVFIPSAAVGTELPSVWVADIACGTTTVPQLVHCLNIHPPDPTAEWSNISWAAALPDEEPESCSPVPTGSVSSPDLALLAALEEAV